jgi:TolB protein
MLVFMRKLLFCISLAVLSGTTLINAQTDVLPPVVRNLGGDVIPVAVKSSTASIQAELTKAFSLHGAYVLADEAKADFVFSVEPAGDNLVTLEILSGNPAKSLLRQQVGGSNLADAVARAADVAVARTTGLKGIFAGTIAFVAQHAGTIDLYESDLLFENVRQLTHDNAQCTRPSISPDGRTILYTSYCRNGFPDIYKIDIASGRRDAFLSFNGVNTGATFSPDGSRVAMILSGTGNAELYTISSSCKDMQRLTKNKNIESDPTWSPDGKQIIFASDTPGKPQLYLIDANGGEMRRVPPISNYSAEPTWNPVDISVIATTIMQGSAFEVAVYNLSTNENHVVSEGSGDAIEPSWTSDGRHLIYTERTPNHRRLVLLDTKTGHKGYLSSLEWDASAADYVYP